MFGAPSAEKISGIIDSLFCARFYDKGTCGGCKNVTMGAFGVDGCTAFYCRRCWGQFLSKLSRDEFSGWQQWSDQEIQKLHATQSLWHHQLKCLVLAVSQVPGASVSLPSTLSAFDRQAVHALIEQELRGAKLQHKSFGAPAARFLFVGNGTDGYAQAAAMVSDNAAAGLDALTVQFSKIALDTRTEKAAAHSGAPRPGGAKSDGGSRLDDAASGEANMQAGRAAQPPPPPQGPSPASTGTAAPPVTRTTPAAVSAKEGPGPASNGIAAPPATSTTPAGHGKASAGAAAPSARGSTPAAPNEEESRAARPQQLPVVSPAKDDNDFPALGAAAAGGKKSKQKK